jgi:hypothetical protein
MWPLTCEMKCMCLGLVLHVKKNLDARIFLLDGDLGNLVC